MILETCPKCGKLGSERYHVVAVSTFDDMHASSSVDVPVASRCDHEFHDAADRAASERKVERPEEARVRLLIDGLHEELGELAKFDALYVAGDTGHVEPLRPGYVGSDVVHYKSARIDMDAPIATIRAALVARGELAARLLEIANPPPIQIEVEIVPPVQADASTTPPTNIGAAAEGQVQL